MLTAAERQRRSRAHRNGDHSLCDRGRCDDAPDTPTGLRARGRRLWTDLVDEHTSPAERVLLEEACRIADRLDRLDELINADGHSWLALTGRDGEPELTVEVDRVLSEGRQHALALKLIVAELRQFRAPAKTPGRGARPSTTAAQPVTEGVPDGVLDLGAAIRKRRSQTAG